MLRCLKSCTVPAFGSSLVLSVLLECISIILDYPRYDHVLYGTIIIKTCVLLLLLLLFSHIN